MNIKSIAQAIWKPTDVGFGPGEPLRPVSSGEPPRREDYLVSRNSLISPRQEESRSVTYDQMRSLARLHGVLRTVIEKRKDEIKGLEWDITLRSEYEGEDYSSEIREAKKFWNKPDLDVPFDQWLNPLMEDLFVIDAATLYAERDRIGRFRCLQTVDGSTFKVLVDDSGRVPKPPQLAYEQIIKGQPRTGFIRPIAGINPYVGQEPGLYLDLQQEQYTNFEELYYRPYNVSSDGVYGFSHVESIIMTVNVALRRDVSFLEWFRSGNIPQALVTAPENWTPEQITQFMTMFDTYMKGDIANRSGIYMMPGGTGGVTTLSQLTFDTLFDQWLARIICARFGVSPIPYVSQINRAVGEEMEEASRDEGLVPIMHYLKEWFDDITENMLGFPMLQFTWTPGQNYGKDDSEMDLNALDRGVYSVNEIRVRQGKQPFEGTGDEPGPLTQKQETPFGLPQGQQEDDLPRLSIGDEDNLPELTIRAITGELTAWEKFVINRFGKKSVRPFEVKVISQAMFNDLQAKVEQAKSMDDLKAIFTEARQNMHRTRTPSVESDLSKLIEEYTKVLARTMEKARE